MSRKSVRTRRVADRKSQSRRAARQAEFEFRSWGGVRKGAGRKPRGERPGVPHISRPMHKARFPLLVTSRLRPGLHSLRHGREAECIRAALAGANRAAGAGPSGSAPFQVVHHSIQSNHLHLIVEAKGRAELTAGMRGLLVRIARALNRLWDRHGPVFSDRFHEHELRTRREVRNALVYVLQNLRKHRIWLAGPDPYSSGPEFDGWTDAESGSGATRFGGEFQARPAGNGGGGTGVGPHLRAARSDCPRAQTWLLGVGWQRYGRIDPRESPRPVA